MDLKRKYGNIYYKDENIKDLSIKRKGRNYRFSFTNPNQMISKQFIYDEVALGLRLRNVDEEGIKERVEKLGICGLSPL